MVSHPLCEEERKHARKKGKKQKETKCKGQRGKKEMGL
jgi:hypothetical protein